MRLSPITIALRALRGERPIHGHPLPTPTEAAANLPRLTGQDFGEDAAAWGEWLWANRWVYTAGPDHPNPGSGRGAREGDGV
jgi:hypothetical protein